MKAVHARYPQYYGKDACRCHDARGRCYCAPLPPREADVRLWRHFVATIEWRIEAARRDPSW